jgi:hypothetical protein
LTTAFSLLFFFCTATSVSFNIASVELSARGSLYRLRYYCKVILSRASLSEITPYFFAIKS